MLRIPLLLLVLLVLRRPIVVAGVEILIIVMVLILVGILVLHLVIVLPSPRIGRRYARHHRDGGGTMLPLQQELARRRTSYPAREATGNSRENVCLTTAWRAATGGDVCYGQATSVSWTVVQVVGLSNWGSRYCESGGGGCDALALVN